MELGVWSVNSLELGCGLFNPIRTVLKNLVHIKHISNKTIDNNVNKYNMNAVLKCFKLDIVSLDRYLNYKTYLGKQHP